MRFRLAPKTVTLDDIEHWSNPMCLWIFGDCGLWDRFQERITPTSLQI